MRKSLQDTEISRRRILAAAEQVFGQYGYVGAHMDKIARMTGMTKGAIFWHYGSKLGLFQAVLEKAALRVKEIIGQAFASRAGIMEQCQQIMLTIQRDLAFKVMLQLESADAGGRIPKSALQAVKREIAAIFQDLYKNMERARKRGELEASANTLEILMTLILFMSGFTQIEKVRNMLMVKQTLDGETAIRMIFSGLNSFRKSSPSR